MPIDVIHNHPNGVPLATLIVAHGAGAPMDSDFMEEMCVLLATRGIHVIRFEFPYMAERRQGGKKRPPNRQPELLACWRQVVDEQQESGQRLFIGGKSMGGRMASLVASELDIEGVVCLGYPFHPPNKPERLRTEHLLAAEVPVLVVQGTRDALGNADEVPHYGLSEPVALHWLEDGDHSFKPRKKSGFTQAQHLEEAADAIVQFVQNR